MTEWLITPCQAPELEAVVALVNSAYRGDSSRAGWTTEADYLDGQRTSLADLRQDLAAETAPVILVLRETADGPILACVLAERTTGSDGRTVAYIGMVTVNPAIQAKGLGRVMLEAAEALAKDWGAVRARMTVVSIRDTLIAWYERRGYRLTGERLPFPYDDARFGEPRRPDLEFLVLEKPLAGPEA
ncbi:MAG: GNAT family N-acetyltransferase [Caulobacteraceae bacterium]|nr:GNAT family N-acetyltransferase [Caulobacteraceae bacterium]